LPPETSIHTIAEYKEDRGKATLYYQCAGHDGPGGDDVHTLAGVARCDDAQKN
jgi:hypothetical protein